MKKMEKAFDTLCIAAIPFFLLLAAICIQMEGKWGIAVMAVAFSFFLLFVRYIFRQTLRLHLETKQSEPETVEMELAIQELRKKVGELERHVKNLEFQRRKMVEYLNAKTAKSEKSESGSKSLQQDIKVEKVSEKESMKSQKEIVQKFCVNLDPDVLDRKKEMETTDKIKIYREGMGKYFLIDFRELWPKDIKNGNVFTEDVYKIFKACGMEKIFSLNNQDVINHKILHVEPVILSVSDTDKAGSEFYGELKQKGTIEVGDSLQ